MNGDSCGTCRHHDNRYGQNGNGNCTNPDSPRHNVVTGQQGHCASWTEIPPPPAESFAA